MLPTSRNMTFSDGTPVDPTTLNDLMDCVIGMKRPSSTRWFCPSTPNVLGSGNSMAADHLVFGASNAFQGMPLGGSFESDRITGFAVRLEGAGGTYTIALGLYLNEGSASPTLIGTLTIVNPPASWATYSVTLSSPITIAPGQSLFLSQTALGGIASSLGPVGITSDRL